MPLCRMCPLKHKGEFAASFAAMAQGKKSLLVLRDTRSYTTRLLGSVLSLSVLPYSGSDLQFI